MGLDPLPFTQMSSRPIPGQPITTVYPIRGAFDTMLYRGVYGSTVEASSLTTKTAAADV